MVNGHILVSILVLATYVAISYVVGRLLVARLATHPSPPIRIGAPLIGAGILALQLWLYGSLHVPWNRVTLLAPWLVLAVLGRRRLGAALVGDWEQARQVGRALTQLEPLELVLVVTGSVIALTYLLNLVTQPVIGIDAVAMWLFKAKLYYAQNAVDLRPVAADLRRNLDYPPLFSLMVSTLYTLMGRVDDIFGKSVNFLFFIVGTASFIALVRSLMSRVLTVLFGFLLVAMPIFSFALFSPHYMGWADYPFGIWMLVSLICLFDGVRGDDGVLLLFAVIAAAMAALTKNEGLSFLAIILLLAGYRLARKVVMTRALPRIDSRLLVTGLLALAPVLLWQLYIRGQGFDHVMLSHRHWGQVLAAIPGRAVQILRGTRPLASLALDYPWIAGSFLLASLLLLSRRPPFGAWVYAAVSGQIAAYFIAYLLTPYDLDYILATTFGRLILQLAPSILLLLAITSAELPAPLADPFPAPPRGGGSGWRRELFPSPSGGGQGGGTYPLSVSDESADLDRLQRAWDVAGKDDPFWSVLSVREKRKNRWDTQEFFQTGIDEINEVISHLRQLGVDVGHRRALDFGCGPGRLSQALASYFDQVDGVDISPSMIGLAERLNQRPDRCRYHLNDSDDLRRFNDQTFDLVYSSITLQHVGPANARSYLKEFIRVLLPGGVLVFQLPGRHTGRLSRLKSFAPAPVVAAYRRLRYHNHPAASMHGIPREEVVRFCETNGVTVLDVQANQEAGAGWESFRYFGRRVLPPASRA